MRLCVLLTTRGLLLSSVSLRSSHRSISACASQVNNPNNHAYWKSRGYSSRPDNWESAAEQRAAEGQTAAQLAAEEQADPPAPPAAARVTVINDILAEFDVMSARLGELTRMLREELIRQQREGDAESEAVILTEENDPAQMRADIRGGRMTQKRRM